MVKVKKKGGKGAAKKRWIQILAPRIFNQQVIGETYVYDPREALGKPIAVNLMTLTRNPKQQGINVSFLITGQHEDKLTSDFTGFRIMPSVVRRMMRRGRDKIEDSFLCTTSDGKKIRIKPIIVTRSKAKSSILAALRKSMRQYLAKTASKTTYEQLSKDIIDHRLQREMRSAIAKIFPVSTCEIRWLILLKEESKPRQKKPEETKTTEGAKAEATV
jgi:ribosomal protein S3AE